MMLAPYTNGTTSLPPVQAITAGKSLTETLSARKAIIPSTETIFPIYQVSPEIPAETAGEFIKPLGWGHSLNSDRSDLRLIARIRELGTYREGWDGRGGLPACPKAIEDAEAFMRKLPLEEIYTPYISLAGDGEINFFLDKNGMRVDLGFYGTGMYSFYVRLSDGKEYFGDDIDITDNIPSVLLASLSRCADQE
jgi:hypothetical protein